MPDLTLYTLEGASFTSTAVAWHPLTVHCCRPLPHTKPQTGIRSTPFTAVGLNMSGCSLPQLKHTTAQALTFGKTLEEALLARPLRLLARCWSCCC
jgi:hypothetical protein